MFKLLFSTQGAISRGKFLLGVFDLIGITIVVIIAWSLLYMSALGTMGGVDFSKVFNTMKNQTSAMGSTKQSTTANTMSQEELKKQMDANAEELKQQIDADLKDKKTGVTIIQYSSAIFLALYYLTTLWCKLCLFLKRLTDIGLTRWLAITPFLAGGLIMFSHVTWLTSACLGLVALFYLAMFFWPSRS